MQVEVWDAVNPDEDRRVELSLSDSSALDLAVCPVGDNKLFLAALSDKSLHLFRNVTWFIDWFFALRLLHFLTTLTYNNSTCIFSSILLFLKTMVLNKSINLLISKRFEICFSRAYLNFTKTLRICRNRLAFTCHTHFLRSFLFTNLECWYLKLLNFANILTAYFLIMEFRLTTA